VPLGHGPQLEARHLGGAAFALAVEDLDGLATISPPSKSMACGVAWYSPSTLDASISSWAMRSWPPSCTSSRRLGPSSLYLPDSQRCTNDTLAAPPAMVMTTLDMPTVIFFLNMPWRSLSQASRFMRRTRGPERFTPVNLLAYSDA
jgi:hypothetical protein